MEPQRGQMDPNWSQSATVPRAARYLFTRHLALLLSAGCPLLASLDVLMNQADHPVLAEVVWTMKTDVQSGHYLSKSCSRFPRIFSNTYIGVLKISENTGQIVSVLEQLADWLEKDAQTLSKIKAALTYPLVVVVVTLVLSFWMCYSVLPKILQAVVKDGQPVPLLTQLLMNTVGLLHQPTNLVVAAVLLLATLITIPRLWGWLSPAQKLNLWEMALALPVAGGLLRDACLIRYCSAAAILLASGTDLLKSMRMAAASSGNLAVESDYPRLKDTITEAGKLSLAMLEKPRLYGSLLPHLVGAFEEIGRTDQGFNKAKDYLEESVDQQIASFQSLIEPLLLSFLALLVLFFLLSVMLPLYAQISSNM